MKELAYIQSTGSQWIDTGIKAASNLKFEIVFETSGTTNYQAVFGGRTGSKKFYFLNSVVANYSQKELGFGGSIYKPNPTISTHNVKTTLVWDGTSCTLTTKQGSFTQSGMSGSFSDGLNQYLFCFNDSGTANNNGNMKLYSCKIYSAGTLVRDFIPVLDDNDVACLYDRVTSAYFYNQGSGTFTVGNKPKFLNYIQSTGTQYINTGKIPTINTKFEITISDVVNDSGEKAIFGSGSYSSNTYLLTKDGGTHYLTWYYPTKQTVSTNYTAKHKIELYRGSITVDDVVITSGTTTGATSFSAVTLFNVANGYFSKYKLYGFKMYESDQLVLDAVPALDGTTVCLYDNVSESFLYNSGSGDFVSGGVIVSQKFLLESGGDYYTISGGSLTNIGSTLNAQLFADYGLDDVPDWSDYSSLSNPTVLCWNSDEFINMIATTTGLPQPQTITTAGISLTTAGTDGIDYIDIVESGSPTYAFSVDNGTTWKIWNGSAWVTSSGTDMDGADVEAITKAQWDLLIDGESFIKIRFTLSAAADNVESITIMYANV